MDQSSYIPQTFLEYIQGIIPEGVSFDAFLKSCQTPLRKSIRVNTLKIDVRDFVARVTDKQWQLSPIPWCPEGFWLTRPQEEEDAIPLGNTAEHMLGLFYIQEASSMMPPAALFHDSGDNEDLLVMDMAAAPGSKTTQIAAYMKNQGAILANELSSSRLKVLSANIQRCGVRNVATTHYDAQMLGGLTEQFDRILLDAPCSGEGAIRKDPDAMRNWSLPHLDEIATLQKSLITAAFNALKPGGVMVYSTCTLNRKENQEVIAHLIEQFGDALVLEPLDELFEGASASSEQGMLHVWPQLYDSEGFFVARIRKLDSVTNTTYAPLKVGKFPYEKASTKASTALAQYLSTQFGLTLPKDAELYQRNETYWLIPKALTPLLGKAKFQRVGLKLAEQFKKNYRISHDFALALGHQSDQRQPLTLESLKTYYQGRDISQSLDVKGEVLLAYEGFVAGSAKALPGKIKNALPRELVRDNRLIT